MLNPITVKELKDLLDKAIELGYGDDFVQVSDNSEASGYHFIYSQNFGVDKISFRDEQKEILYLD